MSVESSAAALARSLFEAEQTLRKAEPLHSSRPNLTKAESYAIQREVDKLREDAGARPTGWKIGLASRAFMARVGADEPFWARTYSGKVFESPATIDLNTWFRAQFEPELGLVLGTDLAGPGVTIEQARAAIRAVRPAFEIVDTRPAVDGLVVLEMIADSGSHAGSVLGPEISADGLDLDAVTVVVRDGDGTETPGAATILMDGPSGCLAWLANRVADSGLTLRAGDIILSGTMTGAHPITGQPATVTYSGLGPEPITLSVAGM
ncbi:MAG TPA: fumarylacetoacetate hydrolase family protein [Thermomicrobiales bacterium]|nr:fumarylacetoacetate hydrolase family protein [Thermomicrobiales bacterium]